MVRCIAAAGHACPGALDYKDENEVARRGLLKLTPQEASTPCHFLPLGKQGSNHCQDTALGTTGKRRSEARAAPLHSSVSDPALPRFHQAHHDVQSRSSDPRGAADGHRTSTSELPRDLDIALGDTLTTKFKPLPVTSKRSRSQDPHHYRGASNIGDTVRGRSAFSHEMSFAGGKEM